MTEEPIQEIIVLDQPKPPLKLLMLERLNLVFGEANVDFNTQGAIIHFPIVEITNNTLKEDVIDLYVKLTWEYDNTDHRIIRFQNRMMGCRTNYTAEHLFVKYSHSHLPKLKLGYPSREYGGNSGSGHEGEKKAVKVEWRNFCLGNDAVAQTLGGLNIDFDLEKFYILLNLIDDFVRWESLDGGPHIKMEKIVKTTDTYVEVDKHQVMDFPYHQLKLKMYEELAKEADLTSLDYYAEGNNIIEFINPTVAFNFLEQIVLRFEEPITADIETPKVKKLGNKYFSRTSSTEGIREHAENLEFHGTITFKGEELQPKYIISATSQEDELTEKINKEGIDYTHPNVTDTLLQNFKKNLLIELNKKDKWKLITIQ